MKKISLLVGCLLLHSLLCADTDPAERQIRKDADAAIALLFPTTSLNAGKTTTTHSSHACAHDENESPISLWVTFLQFLAHNATYSDKQSNPFTYNLNLPAKATLSHITFSCEKNTLEKYDNALEKLPQSQSSEQRNAEIEAYNDLLFSIQQTELAHKRFVHQDTREHFPLLFDPATGILN